MVILIPGHSKTICFLVSMVNFSIINQCMYVIDTGGNQLCIKPLRFQNTVLRCLTLLAVALFDFSWYFIYAVNFPVTRYGIKTVYLLHVRIKVDKNRNWHRNTYTTMVYFFKRNLGVHLKRCQNTAVLTHGNGFEMWSVNWRSFWLCFDFFLWSAPQ